MLYKRCYSQRSSLSTLPDVALRQLALQTRAELLEVKSKGQGLGSAAGAATQLPASGVWGLGFRASPIMENQTEKKMDNEMEAGII